MTRRLRSTLALGLLASTLAYGACALPSFNKVEVLPTVGAGGSGGTGGALAAGGQGGSGGGGDGGSCTLVGAVQPPVNAIDGGTDSFVAALFEVDLNDDITADPKGLDLDNLCTCGDDGPGCIPITEPICDGDTGQDTASRALFVGLASSLPTVSVSETFTDGLKAGAWTVLLRVRDYNSEEHDAQVTVDWFLAGGLPMAPVWDGSDAWPVYASSAAEAVGLQAVTAVVTDTGAYVNGDTLVANFPSVSLSMAEGMARISMTISDLTLQANIVSLPGGPALHNGLMSGRLSQPDAFAMLASFRDEVGLQICTDNSLYNLSKTSLCNRRDVFLGGVGGPTESCDALSWGIGFRADPAQLGLVAADPMPQTPCPNMTDPTTDFCIP